MGQYDETWRGHCKSEMGVGSSAQKMFYVPRLKDETLQDGLHRKKSLPWLQWP
jgi:hypothetical protein